jgi:N-acetylmuramic acid 6-phosphate etherase
MLRRSWTTYLEHSAWTTPRVSRSSRVSRRSSATPRTLDLDTLDVPALLERISREDMRVPDVVAHEIPYITRLVDLVVASFREGGRLIYVGAGTSGRLGVLDASECPPTFGSPPEQVQGVIAGGYDALVRAIEGAEDRADEGGAPWTSAVSTAATPSSASPRAAARRSSSPRSTRAGARRAHRLRHLHAALGVHPRRRRRDLSRGRARGAHGLDADEVGHGAEARAQHGDDRGVRPHGQGVREHDGRPHGDEREARAAQPPYRDGGDGCDADTATRAIADAGKSVKTAIVMLKLGTSRADAEQRLQRAGGFVRAALEGSAHR